MGLNEYGISELQLDLPEHEMPSLKASRVGFRLLPTEGAKLSYRSRFLLAQGPPPPQPPNLLLLRSGLGRERGQEYSVGARARAI